MSAFPRNFSRIAGDNRANTASGKLTSVGFSPTFGHFIGLGFFKGGQARLGEQIKMVDHLRGIETECEIINTVSFDPKGDRLRD